METYHEQALNMIRNDQPFASDIGNSTAQAGQNLMERVVLLDEIEHKLFTEDLEEIMKNPLSFEDFVKTIYELAEKLDVSVQEIFEMFFPEDWKWRLQKKC